MDRLYAQIASSPSPFVPPPQTLTAHFWRNGRTKRSSDDRPILEAQESTDEFNAGDPNNNLHWKKRKRRHKRMKQWNRHTIWAGANLEATIRVVAFLVCTLLLIMLFLLFIDWTILDHGFANAPAAFGPLRWIQLEHICSSERRRANGQNDFTSCCTVSDIINLEKNSAKRVLFFGNAFQNASTSASVDFESEMALRTPQGKSVWNSDTRLWPVDHGLLLNEYVGSMALLPFVFGSFGSGDGDVGEKQRTALVIGLGGGSVDMFWHHKFPSSLNITVYELDPTVVELANRWFGTVNDPTRRTIVGDGIMALEEAVKEGLHYDTILVDACDHDRTLPCPTSQFLLPQTLRNIRTALSPMGTFVVNALPLEAEEVNIRAVQTKLLTTFPTCVRSRMVKEMNNIFACLPYSIDHLEEIVDKVWNKKMAEQIDRLGLRQLLPNAKLII